MKLFEKQLFILKRNYDKKNHIQTGIFDCIFFKVHLLTWLGGRNENATHIRRVGTLRRISLDCESQCSNKGK